MNHLDLGEWTLELGADGVALEGESGDAHVFAPFPGGVLLATLDGLGHGPEAARASEVIADTLCSHAGEPLEQLIPRCHHEARGTRGAVLSAARFLQVESQLQWCGIGNVEARLFKSASTQVGDHKAVAQRGGVVGYQIPSIRVSSMVVEDGDVLVFATDGVVSGFENAVRPYVPAQDLAQDILTHHARGTDDALVFVVRFLRREQ